MAYQNCHNCGSLWSPGSTEWEWQQCSSCGWSPGDPLEDYDEDDDLYEGEAMDDIEEQEDEKYMRKEIEKNLGPDFDKERKKVIAFVASPVEFDCPPQVEKLFEDLKDIKKWAEDNVGIPESRQGHVKYFEPHYPLPDKFGNEIKPIK